MGSGDGTGVGGGDGAKVGGRVGIGEGMGLGGIDIVGTTEGANEGGGE